MSRAADRDLNALMTRLEFHASSAVQAKQTDDWSSAIEEYAACDRLLDRLIDWRERHPRTDARA